MEYYRPYLAMLAKLRARAPLRARFGDSDLVQETLAQIHRDLSGFEGSTEAEFTTWMRRIMATVSGKYIRYHTRQRRDATIERQIKGNFDQSSEMLGSVLVATDTSPSEVSMKRERAVILARALTELPPDYREALLAHRFEGLTMAEMAERMGRSVDSVQKLVARGLLELRRRLEGQI
jgi:RNA polymerase sigma-70 factor (ECF subfamily)